MEMRHYNTWLFSEVATHCLRQITSDTAIIDRKKAKFAKNFQFSFNITTHHFVRFYRFRATKCQSQPSKGSYKFLCCTKNQGKKARSFVFNRRRNRCQATPKCEFLRRKRQIFCKFCSI